MNFLIVQSTYEAVEVALMQGSLCTAPIVIGTHDSSSQLVPRISQLLHDHRLTLADLACIAVNQGPGPFTTLRVVLATVNGLNFATKVPLVGVDGLQALLAEYAQPSTTTVALFNGFGGDAYFGIQDQGTITTGWKNLEQLLYGLQAQHKPLYFIGSGVRLFESQIQTILGEQAIIPAPLPLAPSLHTIGQLAAKKFQAGQTSQQLQPLYLKRPVLENRTIKYV